MEFDLHLHTIASGHATSCTITDMAKKAVKEGLKMIGISDHGPDTLNAGTPSYFRSLSGASRKRCGIDILYGVELNILDYEGKVDLEDEILAGLDYALISMHTLNIKPGTRWQNTNAYINAMKHPNVKIIGHCDDRKFPADYESLINAAIENGVFFEINNSSLRPDGYRGNTIANNMEILKLCRRYDYPVILSSDSHGTEHLGDFRCALELVKQVEFPKHLIANLNYAAFKSRLRK